jgi:branched-chain amino acid transport system substrate-binding protein
MSGPGIVLDGDFPTTYFAAMLWRLLILLAIFAMPAYAQPPLVIGAALPHSGLFADLGAELRKSLLLWQEQVNAGGGLLGRRVELQLLDDRSESIAASRLYEQLLSEHKADVLFGPLGSAATLGAASVAERHRRVLINATGSARAVQKPGFRHVFQVPAPLSAYGSGALELARALGVKRLVIAAREDPSARECATLAREQAEAAGIAAGEIESYAAGTADFSPHANRAKAAGAEGWIAFGLARDAAEMVKSFRKLGYAPRLFVAQGAAEPEFVKRLGQDAEHAIGISAYERLAKTAGNAEFRQAFAKKWSSEPGTLAAEGYAAAKVLEMALRRAGSVETAKLREALLALEAETPLGPYKVDRAGAQVAAKPLLLQIQRGRPRIVWPEALASAKWQPYLPWEERKRLK